MELIIKITLDESWDDYRNCDPDLILEDAIRDLADGVDYEFIKFKENNI